MSDHDDFHTEPVPGLPKHLPEGERLLWQGTPEAKTLVRNALHSRKIAIYFAALAAWKAFAGLSDGMPVAELAFSVLGTLALGGVVLVILTVIARLMVRTTIYTITNKRIVMRFGIALPITFQFPFSQITSADVKPLSGDVGTLVFSLKEHTKISWLILWPHVRGWKMAKPQPALRAIPDVDTVSQLLAEELRAAHGISASAPAKPNSVRQTPTAMPGLAVAATASA